MAIPNINKILEAQAIQRGEETPQEERENDDSEVMEILKLIFEYMKQNNKKVNQQLEAIYEQEEQIKKELEEIRSKNE